MSLLGQLADVLPGWAFLALWASPAAAFLLGLIFRRRGAEGKLIACVFYYAILWYGFTSPVHGPLEAWIAVGTLAGGPVLAFFSLALPLSKPMDPEQNPIARGFPVITSKEQDNAGRSSG
jgi:hypothetical protein